MSATATTTTSLSSTARTALLVIAILFALRLVLAATMPLAFDEAYYWTWSKSLAGGYLDHPPLVAYVIRAGTLIAGDTELGVRLASVLLAVPATWAVWQTGSIVSGDADTGARAALYFNLTLMVGAGTLIVTPDAPLIVAASFVLYALAKVATTSDGRWWLLVGAAAGLALLSKYTALFLGAGILLWLFLVPNLRRWFLSPWPYAGGVLALLIFSPVIAWNLAHGGASFAKQFGRAIVDGFTLRYVGEVLPVQFALASPPVFFLGCAGLYLAARTQRAGDAAASLVLLWALIAPMLAYFLFHSLHTRVEGNWLSPMYPAFAVAAAIATTRGDWSPWLARLLRYARRDAIGVGVVVFALVGLQAATGLFPLGTSEPTASNLGAGWRDLGPRIDEERVRQGAAGVVTTSYAETGWLAFYLPSRPRVEQLTERIRWVNHPQPTAAFWAEPLLYVARSDRDLSALLGNVFSDVRPLVTLPRTRHGQEIASYRLYLVKGARTPTFPAIDTK
ncbi:MAG: glycosyltransferase family 39 protein [Hyphomicrobiales bacterium]|nr:glycosyltransferase family 39 protein [Hyphomicrobiales bacterium]